ncbi:MAG: copper chaperone PCu(A)C [Paracoccaceae bacterium]
MTRFILAAALAFTPLAALATDITITDAYFRAASPMAKSGAVFMEINNAGVQDDQLINATAEIAKRVELHTHVDLGDGVMQMTHLPEGFTIPANGTHMLARGGDHVMFMGLTQKTIDGDMVTLTLTFEHAGDIVVEVPVDSKR